MANDLAQAILASAQRLGADPVDLATVISYETAGTFDPWKAGPTTQWGQHRGLIQWGEPQRAKYGVTQGMPVGAQLQAAERYLQDAGYKPGMGLMDMYSAINAGRVGRNNASDANNGGAPGTVADKVNNQMSGHRQKAAALLGGQYSPSAPAPSGPPAQAPASFGDFVAPQQAPAVDFGSVVADFLAKRQQGQQQQESDAAAERARKLALFG